MYTDITVEPIDCNWLQRSRPSLLLLTGMLYAGRNPELMLMVLVSEQSLSAHGHYRSSFLYLKQNIALPKENGKYDKFIKRIVLLLDELASPVSPI